MSRLPYLGILCLLSSLVFLQCKATKDDTSDQSELLATGHSTDHNLTPDGHTAATVLDKIASEAAFYNVGLLRVTLGKPGSTYDDFISDDIVVTLLEELTKLAATASSATTPSGWRFHQCAKPSKGNWPQITSKSPFGQCAKILTNPRILRREAELSVGIAKVGGRYFPTLELAYPDRAEPWPVFVGNAEIRGLILLRYRPNIHFDSLMTIPLVVNDRDFSKSSATNLKDKFSLSQPPRDIADFSRLLIQRSRKNEVQSTLLAAASAAGLVIGAKEMAEGSILAYRLLSGFKSVGSRASFPKLGHSLFKIGLGGTGALHETARLLKLEEIKKSLPEDSAARARLGIALEIAHLSTYFAVLDLTISGKELLKHSLRYLIEYRVFQAAPKINSTNLNSLRAIVNDGPKLRSSFPRKKFCRLLSSIS
jgi:hypothetical protein